MFDVGNNASKAGRLVRAAVSHPPPPPEFQPLITAGGPA